MKILMRKVYGVTFAVTLVGFWLLTGTTRAAVQTFTCPGGFVAGVPAIPPLPLTSLKTVPNPVIPGWPTAPTIRADLTDYIVDLNAAIQLGKALFWDMQAGSDNKTACATCHVQAGADVRTMNQLNPGPNGTFDLASQNTELTSNSFPISLTFDDIAGSKGVRKSIFKSISNSGAESTSIPTGFRQVTGKNTPPVVNAVFNHRQFWNGRAQPDFNGVNPFGSRDTSARVWVVDSRGNPVQVVINIKNVSLASQAVGPVLNTVEMSAAGRTFPDVGKKMLLLKPLGLQRVSPTDSVLGPLADTTTGLKTTYTSLIKKAFRPKWWNTTKKVSASGKLYSMTEANFSLFWGLSIMLYEATLISDDSPMDQYLSFRVIDPITGALVSESNRPDLLDPVVDRLALEGISIARTDILNGLALFELPVRVPTLSPLRSSFPAETGVDGVGCIGCHLGAELTSSSLSNLTGHGLEPGHPVLKAAGFDLRMERMFMNLSWLPSGPLTPVPLGTDEITFDPANYTVNVTHIDATGYPLGIAPYAVPLLLPVATYDAGWYNIGVRPTADDHGLGGKDPFGKFLSWTQLFQSLPDPTFIKVPGNGIPCATAGNATFPFELLNAQGFPLLSGPLHKTEATDVDGTFKVSHLRNVEFNGPYFHNGGKSTLMQAVEFYDNGGDFDNITNPTKAPAMVPLQLTADQSKSLVAFLLALTDERVRWKKAPFDHPQLLVPNGENLDGTDTLMEIPAVGAGGSTTPLKRFLDLNPFSL